VHNHNIELSLTKMPTDIQLKKLKEYLREMPVEEVLSGLKFAKNRWTAKIAKGNTIKSFVLRPIQLK